MAGASIEEAHAALLTNDRLQFDLPDAAPQPPQPPPWSLHFSWGGAWLGWAVVGIAAAIALVLIWRAWRSRPAEPAAVPTPVTEAPVIRPAVARTTLAAADRLAAQGRFAEAAHALLACGVDEINRRFPALIRPATTSRDIAGLEALPGMIRMPFARIAAVVEFGIFGSRPVSADDFADCRQAFVTSALAGRS